MNGIPVDTLAFKDSENPNNKQIKAFLSDRVMWVNNFWKDSTAPWKGGSGGYGKFNIYSRDSLTELMSHGSGLMGVSLKEYKDKNDVTFQAWNMSINLVENKEYFEVLDSLKKEIDKRITHARLKPKGLGRQLEQRTYVRIKYTPGDFHDIEGKRTFLKPADK